MVLSLSSRPENDDYATMIRLIEEMRDSLASFLQRSHEREKLWSQKQELLKLDQIVVHVRGLFRCDSQGVNDEILMDIHQLFIEDRDTIVGSFDLKNKLEVHDALKVFDESLARNSGVQNNVIRDLERLMDVNLNSNGWMLEFEVLSFISPYQLQYFFMTNTCYYSCCEVVVTWDVENLKWPTGIGTYMGYQLVRYVCVVMLLVIYDLGALCEQIQELNVQGYEVILVLFGVVEIDGKTCVVVGQNNVMAHYYISFGQLDVSSTQLLGMDSDCMHKEFRNQLTMIVNTLWFLKGSWFNSHNLEDKVSFRKGNSRASQYWSPMRKLLLFSTTWGYIMVPSKGCNPNKDEQKQEGKGVRCSMEHAAARIGFYHGCTKLLGNIKTSSVSLQILLMRHCTIMGCIQVVMVLNFKFGSKEMQGSESIQLQNSVKKQGVDSTNEKNSHLMKLEDSSLNMQLFKTDLADYEGLCAEIFGCAEVFLVACPVSVSKMPNSEAEIVEPMLIGTTNVLNACWKAKVKQVVVVSYVSVVMVKPNWPKDCEMDEKGWSDVEFCKKLENYYWVAKIMAELKNWECAKTTKLKIITVCPFVITGPRLQPTINSSTLFLLLLLTNGSEEAQDVFSLNVDMRDIAKTLLLVYGKHEANRRYICACYRRRILTLEKYMRSMYLNYSCNNHCALLTMIAQCSSKHYLTVGCEALYFFLVCSRGQNKVSSHSQWDPGINWVAGSHNWIFERLEVAITRTERDWGSSRLFWKLQWVKHKSKRHCMIHSSFGQEAGRTQSSTDKIKGVQGKCATSLLHPISTMDPGIKEQNGGNNIVTTLRTRLF